MPSPTTFALFAAAALALIVGSLFVVLAAASDSTYAVVAAALAQSLRDSSRARQVKRFVSGGIFVALGLVTATARRT